jgi:hypothetical protein
MKIYVASSWRNARQPDVVAALRRIGHKVYDFRNPSGVDHGFHWSEIDERWQTWDARSFISHLDHPLAQSGFRKDMDALTAADGVVLVMPCGRSAHLEFGFALGQGKHGAILVDSGEPELMYRMAHGQLYTRIRDLVVSAPWASAP